MRKMPELQTGAKQQKMTTTFLGYNHKEIIEDGEMYDMKNLSGDLYPLLAPRKKRAHTSFKVGTVDDPLTGIDGRDQLTFIVGEDVYWNFTKVQGLTVSMAEGMYPKKIVNFGACVLIFPDKKYFNTVNLDDYGDIDRLFSVNGQSVSVTMCRGDGTDYDMSQLNPGVNPPASYTNGTFWIDQSGKDDVLKQYSTSEGWVEVATTYVKISASNIRASFWTASALTSRKAVSWALSDATAPARPQRSRAF